MNYIFGWRHFEALCFCTNPVHPDRLRHVLFSFAIEGCMLNSRSL